MFKKKGLPWSIGIGTDVTDCTTSAEVMIKSKLDWSVNKCSLVAKMPFNINGNNEVEDNSNDFAFKGNIYRECPNAYATYRTDINVPLGLVKSKYEVVQNIEAFNFFDDAIGKDKAVWQCAGMFGCGQKIFVTAKLPTITKVSNDEIENYLVFGNSHDGSTSVNILFTPIRVICTNMLNAALDSNSCRITTRHTSNASEKIRTGAEILHVALKEAKNAEELYNFIASIKIKDTDAMKYLVQLILTKAEYDTLMQISPDKGIERLLRRDYLLLQDTKISMRKANQIATMYEYYLEGFGQSKIVGTGWGLYNAVTGYYSNVVNVNGEKRMDSLCYGTANKTMMIALNNVVAMKEAV